VGEHYSLGADIGPLRSEAIGGGRLSEPDWGERRQLDLIVTLSGADIEITPAWHQVRLPREGTIAPVYFDVIPREAGDLELYLSLLLARELTLIEKFVVYLSAIRISADVQ
jgi:hypothetical protein